MAVAGMARIPGCPQMALSVFLNSLTGLGGVGHDDGHGQPIGELLGDLPVFLGSLTGLGGVGLDDGHGQPIGELLGDLAGVSTVVMAG